MNPFTTQKVAHHPERIADWWRTGDTLPVTMELDMTNRCTDRCPCCAGGRYASTASLEPDVAMRVIDEVADMGVRGLIFTGGGEPLCHTFTPDAMAYASERGLDVGLITNGIPFRPEMWPKLQYASWIRVSLDAASPETYRMTHGTENFDRAVENIRAMARCRAETGLAGTTLGVGFLVGKDTIDEMVNCAKLCGELGVDYLQFRPFHQALRDVELAKMAVAVYEHACRYATDSYSVVWSAHKFRHMAEGGVDKRPYEKCYGHAFASVIGADGTMWLCCHTRGMEKYALGNIHDASVFDLWYGDKRQQAIENIDFADCPPLCRCDPFNRFLWDIRHRTPDHVNFL